MHIGRRLAETGLIKEAVFEEATLMKICRLAMFRKGIIPNDLRLKLVQTLDEETERIARQAIIEVIETEKPPANSVAAYQHEQQWTIQQWELKKAKGKLRRLVSNNLEDMLRRGEIQDPVALHYLRVRNTQPLDFVMPGSWRQVLYPKGISMLGAKARLVGLLALPLLIGLIFYQPPGPQQIQQTSSGAYVCLQQAADSARYLDHLGCEAYQEGSTDPQAFVQAYNFFNDAATRQTTDKELARIHYHRGLAAFAVFRTQGERVNLERAQEDFRKAVLLFPQISTQSDISHLTVGKKQKAKPNTLELIRPDGDAILRLRDGRLSQGTLDETFTSEITNNIALARYAYPPLQAYATVSGFSDIQIRDYLNRISQQLPTGLHQDKIREIAFSPLGAFIATSSDDRSVVIWDLKDTKTLQRITEHRAPVLGMSFSPDEELLVTAGSDGVAIVTEVQTGTRVAVLVGHRGPVSNVDVHPLGELIVTTGTDSTIRLWDIEGQQLQELRLDHGVTEAVFSRTGDFMVVVDEKGKLEVRDALGRLIRSLEAELKPGEVFRRRGALRALSQTTKGDKWLASFPTEGLLYVLPQTGPVDSLFSDANYSFCLSAYTQRNFDIAISRLSNVLSLEPNRADAYLLRGLSYLFKSDQKSTDRMASLNRGIDDLELVKTLSPALLESTRPDDWVGNIADGQDSNIVNRLCTLWPVACQKKTPVQAPPVKPVSLPSQPILFDSIIGNAQSDILLVAKEDKVGFVKKLDEGNKLQIPFIYDEAFDFMNGLAAVRKNGLWGFIDETGQQVIAPQFDGILSRPQSPSIIACVEKSGRKYCIDRQGDCQDYQQFTCESIIKPKASPELLPKKILSIRPSRTADGYIIVGPYSEGLAPVREGDLFGYINQSQKLVIPMQYSRADQFYNGRARVMMQGKPFFIDQSGNCIPTAGAPCN